MGVKRVYFAAYRDALRTRKTKRKEQVLIERFARSMGGYLAKETFEGWLRVVADSKRERALKMAHRQWLHNSPHKKFRAGQR